MWTTDIETLIAVTGGVATLVLRGITARCNWFSTEIVENFYFRAGGGGVIQ